MYSREINCPSHVGGIVDLDMCAKFGIISKEEGFAPMDSACSYI